MNGRIDDIQKANIASVLERLPYVKWDRLVPTLTEHRVAVFGWIGREDQRSDYIQITFDFSLPEGFAYFFNTSSAEFGEDINERLGGKTAPATYAPCQRVEDALGDYAPSSTIRLHGNRSEAADPSGMELTDPRKVGGDLAGPGTDDPHATESIIANLERAVMTSGMAVALLNLQRNDPDPGDPDDEGEEAAVGVWLEGRINKSSPPEQARVLNIMGWEEAAGLVSEIHALAGRSGITPEFERLLAERWAQLETEGAI